MCKELLNLLLELAPWSLCNFPLYLKSALFAINIATNAFFWLVLACSFSFHPSTFNLYESLYFRWVSCRQYSGSCFSTHSDKLYLLIGSFGPQLFKVMTDTAGLVSTTGVTVFHSLFLFFVPFSFFLSLVFHSFSAFWGFNWAFHMTPFPFLS